MKTLIAYYSKTGNTKKIALALAKKLNADVDEIMDEKKRGFFGTWFKGCVQARKEQSSAIKTKKNPATYDIVILGGPVWAWNLIPPLRKYLELHAKNIKQLGFFLTCGGKEGKSFEQVAAFKKPLATMLFLDKNIKKDDYTKELQQFITTIKG